MAPIEYLFFIPYFKNQAIYPQKLYVSKGRISIKTRFKKQIIRPLLLKNLTKTPKSKPKKFEHICLEIEGFAPSSPLYLYSKPQITTKFEVYEEASKGLKSIIGCDLEHDHNSKILEHFKKLGCGAVVRSGSNLRLEFIAGVDPTKCIFNGDGKLSKDILMVGCQQGVLVDAYGEEKVNALLPNNPGFEPQVRNLQNLNLVNETGRSLTANTCYLTAGVSTDDANNLVLIDESTAEPICPSP